MPVVFFHSVIHSLGFFMVIDLFNYTVWKGPSSDLTDGEQLAEWVSGDI